MAKNEMMYHKPNGSVMKHFIKAIWCKIYPAVLMIVGITIGYAIHYIVSSNYYAGIVKLPDSKKSNITIEFENDSNPEISHFAKQLSEPSRTFSVSPLTIQVYRDMQRFSIYHEMSSYVVVSELYGFLHDGTMGTMRTYVFEEDGKEIRLVITRDTKTNKLKEILYSFGDKILYLDKNGDGVWDVIRGCPSPETFGNALEPETGIEN